MRSLQVFSLKQKCSRQHHAKVRCVEPGLRFLSTFDYKLYSKRVQISQERHKLLISIKSER